MSDEPTQSHSWTGEEKLRVVLEAMKSSVSQVCAKYAKYGLTEAQIQDWRQFMVEQGGNIFEPKPRHGSSSRSRSASSKHKNNHAFTMIGICSILLNLLTISFFAAISFEVLEMPPSIATLLRLSEDEKDSDGGSKSQDFDRARDKKQEAVARFSSPTPSDKETPSPVPSIPLGGSDSTGSQTRVKTAPMYGGPEPNFGPGIVSKVEVCKVIAPRVHKIVFVLDLNEYMWGGANGILKYDQLREEMRQAIHDLGEKSMFNVVMFHGVGRLFLYENRLIDATPRRKSEASAWLNFALQNVPDTVKPRVEESALQKLGDGVLGPWKALSAALHFEPDAIFLITGDCASLRPEDYPELKTLGVELSAKKDSPASDKLARETETLRLTVAKWIETDASRVEDLEVANAEIDQAIRQLGIVMPSTPVGMANVGWPWREIFVNFKSSLSKDSGNFPSTHILVSLPKGRSWPVDLERTAREFTQGKGSYTLLAETFFSSP